MEEQKIHSKIRRPILAAAAIAIIGIFAFYFMASIMTSNAVKEKQIIEENYKDWLVENCACVERNSTFCDSGYELNENFCVNETLNTFTNVLKGCSKYECSGTNVTLSNGVWSPKLNMSSNG